MEQLELLRYVLEVLEERQVPYALVGSFASGIWGEPRMTQDIDVVVQLTTLQVESLCDAFPDPDFYVCKAAAREAVQLERQFNVIHPASGNKIDFMIAGSTEWASTQIARRRKIPIFHGIEGCVASPEDVILGKLVYYHDGGSEKHLRDITGILSVCGDQIDTPYLERSASQLGVSDIWQFVLERLKES